MTLASAACVSLLDLQSPQLLSEDASAEADALASADAAEGADGPTCASLSDPANCGRCRRVCPGACRDGVCAPVLLAASADPVTRIALNSTDVVFSTFEPSKGGEIRRCAKSGCNQTASRILADTQPTSLSADDTHVAWLSQPFARGAPRACALDACSSTNLPMGPATSLPLDVLLTNRRVFFSDTVEKKLFACDPSGCTTPDTIESAVTPLLINATADRSGIVFIVSNRSKILRRALAAGPVLDVTTAPAGFGIYDLTVAGADVAFIEQPFGGGPTGALRIHALDGTGSTRTLTSDLPTAIVGDEGYVYFDYAQSGAVVRCAREGCTTPQAVANGLDGPGALAVDASYVYVATKQGVVQLAKP
jgi:hypothetical protein